MKPSQVTLEKFRLKIDNEAIDGSNYTTTFVAYQSTTINSRRKVLQNVHKKGKTVRQCATPEAMTDETTRKQ